MSIHRERLRFFALTYVKDFAKGIPTLQQSLARVFGSLAYDLHEHAVRAALACLLGGVDMSVRSIFFFFLTFPDALVNFN